MVLILGVTWGSSFLLIELALPGIGPAWLAASRIVLAAALMGVVQLFRRQPLFYQPDPLGQFHPGQSRVMLQCAQNASVQIIKHEIANISKNRALKHTKY